MILLIDAGNTKIKWALHDPRQPRALGEWAQSGSLSHQEFTEANAPWRDVVAQRVIVSNVAGKALRDKLTRSFSPQHGVVEWFASQATLAGITNHYLQPTQLGSDRFAAAIGAHALFPGQSLIVATCGTATTIDAISEAGDFVGGMIAPGLKLMAEALAHNTAQLPSVDSMTMTAHFANNTDAAIVSGCLAAQAGAIEHAARELVATNSNPLCVLSGGAAQYIIPSLQIPHQFVDNLVLIGLQVASLC